MSKRTMNQKYATLGIFACCVLSGIWGCNHEDFRIEGNLKGEVNGKYVYLQYADTCRTTIDSAIITDNRFVFKGACPATRLATLFLQEKNEATGRMTRLSLPLVLEKGRILVTANYDSIKPGIPLFDHYKLGGTVSNDLFLEYMKLSAMYDKMDRESFDIYGDYLGNREPGQAYFDRGIVLTTQIDSLNAARVKSTISFMRQHADAEVSAYLLTKILSSLSVDEIDQALALFPESIRKSAIGLYVTDQAETMKKSAVGAQFTDFTLQTPDGQQALLSDYIGKGDYVLLEYWASWCGPCKKEIPHLQEVMTQLGDKNFRIVGVSMDTDAAAWQQAIKEHQITWTQLSTLQGFKDELPKVYRVRGIPTCILIDPSGKIISRNARGSWLDRWLIDWQQNK